VTTQQNPAPWEDTIDLRQWVNALVRRWWVIAVVAALATVAAVVFTYVIQTPAYTSSGGATLPPGSDTAGIGLKERGYLEFARSTPVMEAVRDNLGLDMSAGELRNYYAFRLENGNFITVTATAASGRQAFEMADAWLQVYNQQVQQLLQQDFAERRNGLAQQADLLSRELSEAEDRLADFQLENPDGHLEAQLSALESDLAQGKERLRQIQARSLPELESRLATLQDSLLESGGAAGGGGAPSHVPGASSNGLGALVPPSGEMADNPAWFEMSRGLRMAQFSQLERDLLQSDDRLRQLTLSSIPLAGARVAALERAVADAPLTPDGAAMPDQLRLRLSQDLADARLELDLLLRESEILQDSVAVLRRQLEVARAEVVTFQETVDALQSQAAVRQDIQRVEGDLTARRQEVRQLAASLPDLEEQVRDLRREERAQANTRQALQAQASRAREQHSRVTAQLDGLLAVEPSLGMLSSLSTISEPAEPASPASPQRSRNILLATFLGLMVGTAAALFWDFYRNPTATPQQDPG
jgi:capsular polysaccharide biosynthesis protein